MDYYALMDLVSELGYRLSMCGAETFRVEESVNRILGAYGIPSEAYSVPNCLIVSIETPSGKPMTRMRRIGQHGNDLEGVERYNSLSRRICAEVPDPKVAQQWLQETMGSLRRYSPSQVTVATFLGAFGFAFLYGATIRDALCAGLCGILIGCFNDLMDRFHTNQFFQTICAAFLAALPAYGAGALGLIDSPDAATIGALMLLVPGLLFVNGMRDIIFGDTNSGINRIIQVLLIGAAICLGTATAWTLANFCWGAPVSGPAMVYSFPIQAIATFVGCLGFSVIFNIHGPGTLICIAGGVLTWGAYCLVMELLGNDIQAFLWATIVAAIFSEIMARVRKYPAISYLVVSIFPLIPGASVYYTMNHAVRGDMVSFADQGVHTIAIAGIMAVGMLIVSTVVRIWTNRYTRK